jgi:hypothetical protein
MPKKTNRREQLTIEQILQLHYAGYIDIETATDLARRYTSITSWSITTTKRVKIDGVHAA